MTDAEYGLVLPFDSDDSEFTRGFEAGMLYQRLELETHFEVTMSAANAEMAMRIAQVRGVKYEGTDLGDDWLNVRFYV